MNDNANIGPGDNDYGRKDKPTLQIRPEIDGYKAGPCPTCGEFAIEAERRPDGNVKCRHGHQWMRKYVGCDMAKAGSDKSHATFAFGYTIEVRQEADRTATLVVRDDSRTVAMTIRIAEFPTPEELTSLFAGIKSAANAGISNIDFRLRNPHAADIVDRFFKRT